MKYDISNTFRLPQKDILHAVIQLAGYEHIRQKSYRLSESTNNC
jgi:hypothetical protein